MIPSTGGEGLPVETCEKAIAQPFSLTLSLLQHGFNETSACFFRSTTNIRRWRRSEWTHGARSVTRLCHRHRLHGSACITGLRWRQGRNSLHLTIGHVRPAERRSERHAAADATLALTGSTGHSRLTTGHSGLSTEHLLHECLLISWGQSVHVLSSSWKNWVGLGHHWPHWSFLSYHLSNRASWSSCWLHWAGLWLVHQSCREPLTSRSNWTSTSHWRWCGGSWRRLRHNLWHVQRRWLADRLYRRLRLIGDRSTGTETHLTWKSLRGRPLKELRRRLLVYVYHLNL